MASRRQPSLPVHGPCLQAVLKKAGANLADVPVLDVQAVLEGGLGSDFPP